MAQVQVIQPYQPQSDTLEKVAAYCRVSTDSKDQLNSYRTQIGYYTLKALRFLLEQSLLSETEYEQVCRYNAEIFRPGREYI